MHPRPVREIGEGSNINKGKRIHYCIRRPYSSSTHVQHVHVFLVLLYMSLLRQAELHHVAKCLFLREAVLICICTYIRLFETTGVSFCGRYTYLPTYLLFEYSSELLALHKLANQRIAEQVLIYT